MLGSCAHFSSFFRSISWGKSRGSGSILKLILGLLGLALSQDEIFSFGGEYERRQLAFPFKMGPDRRCLAIFMVFRNIRLAHLATLPSYVFYRVAGGSILVPITAGFPSRRILQADQVVCALDFSILNKYTWIDDECGPTQNSSTCCIAVLSGIGLSTSKDLRQRGSLSFKDAATADACFNSFQS